MAGLADGRGDAKSFSLGLACGMAKFAASAAWAVCRPPVRTKVATQHSFDTAVSTGRRAATAHTRLVAEDCGCSERTIASGSTFSVALLKSLAEVPLNDDPDVLTSLSTTPPSADRTEAAGKTLRLLPFDLPSMVVR